MSFSFVWAERNVITRCNELQHVPSEVPDERNRQLVTTSVELWTARLKDAVKCTCLRITDIFPATVVLDNKRHLTPKGTNVKRLSFLSFHSLCLSSSSFSLSSLAVSLHGPSRLPQHVWHIKFCFQLSHWIVHLRDFIQSVSFEIAG
jgi:hypothetical protein